MDTEDFLINEYSLQYWDKKDMHRIYFPTKTLCDIYGLKCSTYSSGRVSSATLNGDKISNSRATKIIILFQFGKFYYDVDTKQFKSNFMAARKKIHNKLVKTIKSQARGMIDGND